MLLLYYLQGPQRTFKWLFSPFFLSTVKYRKNNAIESSRNLTLPILKKYIYIYLYLTTVRMRATREESNSKLLKRFSASVPKATATREQDLSEYNYNNPVHPKHMKTFRHEWLCKSTIAANAKNYSKITVRKYTCVAAGMLPHHVRPRAECYGVCSGAQSCLTLCSPMDCSPPGSSAHVILQARILAWGALSYFRGPSWSRDWTRVSCTSCIGRWAL